VIFNELVGRNGHDDLAWLVRHEGSKREYRAVTEPGEQPKEDQESEQARHRQPGKRPSGQRPGNLGELRPRSATTGNTGLAVGAITGIWNPWIRAENHSMVNGTIQKPAENAPESAVVRALGSRSIVLVGMMGAGKSSIGRRLAGRLGLPFIDADSEIESAAGMTISEIFDKHGEPYFRAGEARVIARLLDNGPQVLATGGGSLLDAHTRALIGEKGVSIWLKADIEVLLKRTKRRTDRPLAEKIRDLLPVREPLYAQADIVVQSRDVPHDNIVDEIMAQLPKHLGAEKPP
jgi:shikimate kinase